MPRLLVLAALLALTALHDPTQAEKNLRRPLGTTRYGAMVQQLQALRDYDQAHGKRMMLTTAGTSVKGRSLWLVTLKAAPEDGAAAPKKVLYICRQHGHEPASTEGALAFLTQLVHAEDGSALAGELSRATVYVIPMANPDGAEAFLRHNAHDADMNRDWLKRTQPETRALYQTVLRLHPDFVTDQHELYPNDTHPDFLEIVGPGNGATAAFAAKLEDEQTTAADVMQAEGFPVGRITDNDTHPARLAHRWVSLKGGIPAVLFETQRLNGMGRTVAARAAAHTEFMLTILRYASGDRDAMRAEAQGWRDKQTSPVTPLPMPPTDPNPGDDIAP